MNKVVLVGRISNEIDLKFTAGEGTAVATFSIAVDRRFSKDGKKEADFIPIVVWGKQAETVANYSGKGILISIAGRIQTRNYDAKDGTKRYVTEVLAEEVQIIEWAERGQENFNQEINQEIEPVDDGDVPF